MQFSVIITTFNRVASLRRAVDSVLAQDDVEFELIVADDGSTDGTPSYLGTLTDPRVSIIQRQNGGPCAARNAGIEKAAGHWTVFLDDDDMALPGWLATFARLTGDHVGAVCCGAMYVTPEGLPVGYVFPVPMGRLFHDRVGNTLAGTFAVRSTLLNIIQGYDEQMPASQQTELWLRLLPEIISRELDIVSAQKVLVHLERRDAYDRSTKSPAALCNATEILLNKHHGSYARDASARAAAYGILGVNAAKLAHWPEARSALLNSALAQPRNIRRWLRFAIACAPPVAQRLWARSI